ncbi:unnamed protein product [Linum trigynum]|uniref:Uncharacterized protein n=1 Tax=Linum trigynum TaxID=586398 RepID=A0AAV2DJ17_9ROSI
MWLQSNAVPPAASLESGGDGRILQSAVFDDTIWGDHFLATSRRSDTTASDDGVIVANQSQGHPTPEHESREYEVLKEEVQRMVTVGVGDNDEAAIFKKLRLIDAIQRLGVGYHFKEEIEKAIENVHALGGESFIDTYKHIDLHHAALWFRLLRQQGFGVSSDVFRKFKDHEGKFKESLAFDGQGLLSLYEAAHVAIHGEDILDEALSFSTKNLKLIVQDHKTSSSFKKQVEFSLALPMWKCVPRTLARHCIQVYSELDEQASHDETVTLKFAKLDFNVVQRVHQEELHELTMWWASLETKKRFPYARDRLVECYFWINTVYPEPKHRVGRIILTKCGAVLTLLDDFYDNFGDYEQLKILTEAIQRMDISALEELPDIMKEAYRVVIVNLFEEMEQAISGTGPTYGIDYCKQEVRTSRIVCGSLLAEARWRSDCHVPSLEEYLKHANITSSYFFVCPSAYLGIGPEVATREAFEWVTSKTNKMVMASASICRVQNDIMSYPFEQERLHVASAVQCYVKEHGVSDEEATQVLLGRIADAWKDMTEVMCCQKPTPFPTALLSPVINFARSISVIYLKADAFTYPQLLKERIAALFVHPVPL